MRALKLALCLAAGLAAFGPGSAAASDKKVTLCHRPPGNPGNLQTLAVAEAATGAHLAHGDTLGACATGCQGNPLACDDGNACTSDRCLANGECAHTAVTCDDGNTCTTDACHPVTGCLALPREEGSCDDGDACTSGDSCAAGACRGTPVGECCTADWMCNDGNGCTLDRCAGNACRFEARDCGVADACRAGFCDPASGDCGSTPVRCDDGNICTDDLCDSATGCLFLPTSNPPEMAEVSCADALDNDCDGSVDSADADCDACGTGSACTAADAAAFKAGLQASVAHALPPRFCLSAVSWWTGGGAMVDACRSNDGPCLPGCQATLAWDAVEVEPPSAAEAPFPFTVRTGVDVSVNMPIRVEGLGSCTLTIHAVDWPVALPGEGVLLPGGCGLGARPSGVTAPRPATVFFSGCPLTGAINLGEIESHLIGELYGDVILALASLAGAHTAYCPVQP